jgi:hypothetical protein
MLRRTILVLLTFMVMGNSIIAQSAFPKYEIGVNAGTYIYQGDLSAAHYGSFKTPGFAFGVQVTRNLSPEFGVRADFGVGNLRGDDAAFAKPGWRRQRNFAFTASVVEGSIQAIWHPLAGDRLLKPYVFAGIGIVQPRVTRNFQNFNDEYFPDSIKNNLAADLAAEMPGSIPVIPVGVGVKIAVTDRLAINPEASFRYISTDYLDGYSLAAEPGKRDQFFKYSIGIIYSFFPRNRELDCPTVSP